MESVMANTNAVSEVIAGDIRIAAVRDLEHVFPKCLVRFRFSGIEGTTCTQLLLLRIIRTQYMGARAGHCQCLIELSLAEVACPQ